MSEIIISELASDCHILVPVLTNINKEAFKSLLTYPLVLDEKACK